MPEPAHANPSASTDAQPPNRMLPPADHPLWIVSVIMRERMGAVQGVDPRDIRVQNPPRILKFWRAMTANPLIKAPKRIVDSGSWEVGRVKPGLFPTHAPMPVPAGSRWRCLRLSADCGADLRLLIIVNSDRNNFHAWLGAVREARLYVLSAFEAHAGEPGLHCHALCGHDWPGYSGSVRYPGIMRVPRPGARHRRVVGCWDEKAAWRESTKFYRVDDRPEGALI